MTKEMNKTVGKTTTEITYNLIDGIVDLVIDKFSNGTQQFALKLNNGEIEMIAELYGLSVQTVLDKIIEQIESTPLDDRGNYLCGRWEKTMDGFTLYFEPDEDYD